MFIHRETPKVHKHGKVHEPSKPHPKKESKLDKLKSFFEEKILHHVTPKKRSVRAVETSKVKVPSHFKKEPVSRGEGAKTPTAHARGRPVQVSEKFKHNVAAEKKAKVIEKKLDRQISHLIPSYQKEFKESFSKPLERFKQDGNEVQFAGAMRRLINQEIHAHTKALKQLDKELLAVVEEDPERLDEAKREVIEARARSTQNVEALGKMLEKIDLMDQKYREIDDLKNEILQGFITPYKTDTYARDLEKSVRGVMTEHLRQFEVHGSAEKLSKDLKTALNSKIKELHHERAPSKQEKVTFMIEAIEAFQEGVEEILRRH